MTPHGVGISGLELDHFVLFVPDAAAAAPLVSFGLRVGHEGLQRGTSAGHTVFFFDNTYLELVWPQPGCIPFADAPAMRAAERCADPRWCPFGVAVRSAGPGPAFIPFETWDYAAPFLPEGAASIPVGATSEDPNEPVIVVSLVSGRPDRRRNPPVLQRAVREITQATVVLPAPPSKALQTLAGLVPLAIERGPFALRLAVPGGERIDLRPRLPLVLG